MEMYRRAEWILAQIYIKGVSNIQQNLFVIMNYQTFQNHDTKKFLIKIWKKWTTENLDSS